MNVERNTTAEASGEVTPEWLASVDFEAWTKGPDTVPPPSNHEWAIDGVEHLRVVRLAFATMFKAKQELRQSFVDHPAELTALVDGIGVSVEFFRSFVILLEASEMRLLVSASAACEETDR